MILLVIDRRRKDTGSQQSVTQLKPSPVIHDEINDIWVNDAVIKEPLKH